jgi:hypothetical protein
MKFSLSHDHFLRISDIDEKEIEKKSLRKEECRGTKNRE